MLRKSRIPIVAVVFLLSVPATRSQQLHFIEDSYIRGGVYATENYGTDTFLIVKGHPTDLSYERKIFLRFRTDSSGTGQIHTAKLKLFASYVDGNVTLTLSTVSDVWNETTITWGNAPACIAEIDAISLSRESEQHYAEWNITQAFVGSVREKGYIDLCISDPLKANHHVKFYSREAATDKHPCIELTLYNEPPAEPSGLNAVPLTTEQICLTWTDNSDNETKFLIERAVPGEEFRRIDSVETDVTEYSDIGLKPSGTCLYRIQSCNPSGYSGFSDTVSATTFAKDAELTYFFDYSQGNDRNEGLSPESPWQSLARASSVVYLPGSKIFFKSGETWHGTLRLHGSGSEGNPVTVDKYGSGDLPKLLGPGTYLSNALEMVNTEWWEITNLEISNNGAAGNSAGMYKRGIYVLAKDIGEVSHLYFTNLKIHDIDGVYNPEGVSGESGKDFGGIFLEITGDIIPTWFNDMLIENCEIYNVGRTGISNQSTWWQRSLTSKYGDTIMISETGPVLDNWVPGERIIIRGNRFEQIDGNGLIIRVTRKALVEKNHFIYCGSTLSGNAAFCFNTDSTIFQYNEASHTIYNPGDTDARGLDSDFRTKHTIIQYNYLHHNEYGGVVVTGGPGNAASVPRFNDGTIIRYNILVDNGHHIIRTSGKATNIFIYNNVFFSGENLDNIILAWHGSWSGAWAKGSYYYNNVFYHLGKNPEFKFESSIDNVFSHNSFYGEHAYNEPPDQYKITADPAMINPGPADDIHSLEGFMLTPGSPLIRKGVVIPGAPEMDFYGNPLKNNSVDIGVHETLFSGLINRQQDRANGITIFPNPTRDQLYLLASLPAVEISSYALYDLNGRQLFAGTLNTEANGSFPAQISLKEEGVPAGMYFIRIVNKDQVDQHWYKIIVKFP